MAMKFNLKSTLVGATLSLSVLLTACDVSNSPGLEEFGTAPAAMPELAEDGCVANVSRLDLQNWYGCENNKRWLGKTWGLLEVDVPAGTSAVIISGRTYGDRKIIVKQGDNLLLEPAMISGASAVTINLDEPATGGPVTFEIAFDGEPPFTPQSIGESDDTRKLVFFLYGVEFQ